MPAALSRAFQYIAGLGGLVERALVLQSGHIEAKRVNTRCYDTHEKLPYLPKQRYGLFSTKTVLLDFIALYAEGLYLWLRFS